MKKSIFLGMAIMTLSLPLAAQNAETPFKGIFSSGSVAAEINLYQATVPTYPGSDEKCFGLIEGVYMNGNRIDEHAIVKVVSIDGNKAVVKYLCSFDGDEKPREATLTYNPATGSLTIDRDDSVMMCYQAEKMTLKSKKAAAKKTGTKKSSRKKRR